MNGIVMLIPVVIFLVVVGGFAMIAMRRRQSDMIVDRLSQYTERTMSLEELELQLPFRERVLLPLATKIFTALGNAASPGKQNERLRQNLMMAGNPGNLTPAMFVGIRMVAGLVIGGLFVLITSMAGLPTVQVIFYSAVGLLLGFLIPVMWLGSQMKKRKKAILKALPDALDLLTISVEAGLGFDLALQRVGEKWDNELCREFRKVLSDLQLGMPHREALRSLVVRTGVDDVATFVAAVIQAMQLGVSMGKILKIQSDQLRIRRRQRAEEAAQKAPVKMLFPMVFLIFPAMFVVILGPAIPRLLGSKW